MKLISMRSLIGLLIVTVGMLGLTGSGQQSPPPNVPIGFPPTEVSKELNIQVWMDRAAYAVGETAKIFFEINKPAYVYIYDIQADGQLLNIFPNQFTALMNPLPPGTYALPDNDRYKISVAPPLGTDKIVAIASGQPLQLTPQQVLGATIPTNPQGLPVGLPQGFEVNPAFASNLTYATIFPPGAVPPSSEIAFMDSEPPLAVIGIGGGIFAQPAYYGVTPKKKIMLISGEYQLTLWPKDTAMKPWTIPVALPPGPQQPIVVRWPKALFTFAPVSGQCCFTLQTIIFDASPSVDPDGTITKYQWDFGTPVAVVVPMDPVGKVMQVSFAAPGMYKVTLTVTDNMGAQTSASQVITVQ